MKIVKERPVMQTAEEVIGALRLKYPTGAYALLEQVGNGTGFNCGRHCDALVMSLWPSRGLDITGIEVKVRRSDWLKELGEPAKAEAIAKYCDYWFLAVGDENIVQPGELPPTWGLLVPTADGKMRCKTEAQRLSPNALDRSFVASVMRQVAAQLTDEARLKAEYQRGEVAGRKAQEEYAERMRGIRGDELRDLKEAVAKFEKASGVNVNRWNGEQIGDAVRLVLSGYDGRVRDRLRRLHESALHIAKEVEDELGRTPDAPRPRTQLTQELPALLRLGKDTPES